MLLLKAMMTRKIFQCLPGRLQSILYYRLFCSRRRRYARWFDNAPLRLEPDARMKLSPQDSFHGEIAFCGIYEAAESTAIHSLARGEGGLLVDVGANYGYYTLMWCAAHPGNKAIAIEASPRNVRALRENIQRNGFEDRVRVMEWAATNKQGVVSFELGSDEETGWGGIAKNSEGHSINVAGQRLDENVNERVTVLKVDCEGADAWVIEGAGTLLDRGLIGHVFYEENISRQELLGIPQGSASRRLLDYGYRVNGIGKQCSNFHAKRARV